MTSRRPSTIKFEQQMSELEETAQRLLEVLEGRKKELPSMMIAEPYHEAKEAPGTPSRPSPRTLGKGPSVLPPGGQEFPFPSSSLSEEGSISEEFPPPPSPEPVVTWREEPIGKSPAPPSSFHNVSESSRERGISLEELEQHQTSYSAPLPSRKVQSYKRKPFSLPEGQGEKRRREGTPTKYSSTLPVQPPEAEESSHQEIPKRVSPLSLGYSPSSSHHGALKKKESEKQLEMIPSSEQGESSEEEEETPWYNKPWLSPSPTNWEEGPTERVSTQPSFFDK